MFLHRNHRLCHLSPSHSPLLRDCLGYRPFSPHTLSLWTTCSPCCLNLFIPQGFCVASSLRFVCANLSLVSTSKQKRLSMDSVFRRMQDFSVSWVGPCRTRKKSFRYVRHRSSHLRMLQYKCMRVIMLLRSGYVVNVNVLRLLLVKHLFSCGLLLTRHHDHQSPVLMILAVIFDPRHTQSPWRTRETKAGQGLSEGIG